MNVDLANGELRLAENRPISMVAAKGVIIRCLSGTIWVTLAGQSEDVFLNTGQVYRITNQRLALIESVGTGSIRIESPRANTVGQRWINCMQKKWLPIGSHGAVG